MTKIWRARPEWATAVLLVALAVPLVWWWRVGATAPPLPESCVATGDAITPSAAVMVRIAGGRFTMGSEDFRAEEAPVRQTAVDDFWIDVHDVTNAQFARFVRETSYVTVAERASGNAPAGALVFKAPPDVRNLGDISQWWAYVPGASWRHPEGPSSDIAHRRNHPVVNVAYEDAEAYARWAHRDLPTEAQWEYAARGGLAGQAYTWGSEPDSDDAPKANNWRGVFPVLNLGAMGFKGTSPVGCFPANGYGLYDMAGNVWQWTRDAWTPDHSTPVASEKAQTIAAAPTETRVIKGGSFLCATNFCMRYRPAARQPGEAATGASHIGFRTVLATSPH